MIFIIIHSIDNISTNDVTEFPKIGLLATLTLKLNIPNSKMRYIFIGLKRIEISSYEEENKKTDQEKASIKEESKQQVETTSKQNKDKEETESDSERNDIEEVSVKGVVYQYNQESAKVVKCNSSEKIITVLDQIEGVSVTEVGEETFRDCNHFILCF